jgi:putative oxidoreductase
MEPFGPAVLRLAAGAIFIAHGAQKLFAMWGGGGLIGTASYFADLGLAPAFPLAALVGVLEFGGGLMLVAGAFTRPVSILLTGVMLAAVWTARRPHGFFINWALAPDRGHGYEFHLVLVGALVCLALTGAGILSIDDVRARSAAADAAGRARLRGKL